MNKFENIKVGDTVYLHRGVRYGFNSDRWFYVPVEVTKTTATQFTCGSNNRRYQKDGGRQIGGAYHDRVDIKSEDVFDQTNEMIKFEVQVKKANKATNLIYELDKNRNAVSPFIDMKIVEDFITHAEKLLLEAKKSRN